MNKHLLSDKVENIIKELAEVHLELSNADACCLKLDNGGCVVFGSKESVIDLVEDE